jgi:hypothetical protein
MTDQKNTYPPPKYPDSSSKLKQDQPKAQEGMSALQPHQAEGGSGGRALEGREWSHKLFDCFGADYKTCTYSPDSRYTAIVLSLMVYPIHQAVYRAGAPASHSPP